MRFMRGCGRMDVTQARRLWSALAVSGFVTLKAVDPWTGELLGSLAACLWASCGSVEQAWRSLVDCGLESRRRSCFNKSSKLRISLEDFNSGCLQVNYEGDSSSCYRELCSEKASHGLSRKDRTGGTGDMWHCVKRLVDCYLKASSVGFR